MLKKKKQSTNNIYLNIYNIIMINYDIDILRFSNASTFLQINMWIQHNYINISGFIFVFFCVWSCLVHFSQFFRFFFDDLQTLTVATHSPQGAEVEELPKVRSTTSDAAHAFWQVEISAPQRSTCRVEQNKKGCQTTHFVCTNIFFSNK